MNTPVQCDGRDSEANNQAEHERGEKIRKRIGEALILLIYLLFDFRDEWPKSHALALIAGVIGICAIALMEMTWRRWSIFAIAATVIAAIVFAAAPAEVPEETAYHGWLLPAADPFPDDNTCTPKGTKQNIDWVDVLLSRGGVVTHADNLTVLQIGERPVIRMERSQRGLSVDVDMVNASGALVARIEKNEWHATPSQIAYTVRPDRSTLAVYDLNGRELLWLRYMNRTAVKIRGLFYNPGHETPVTITDKDIAVPGDMSMRVPIVSPDPIQWFTCFVIGTEKFSDPLIVFN